MQRTIAVEVTGQNQVKAMQKLIDKLQKSVLEVEKNIAKGRGGKPLSFKVNVDLNERSMGTLLSTIRGKFNNKEFKVKVSLLKNSINDDIKELKQRIENRQVRLKVSINKAEFNRAFKGLKEKPLHIDIDPRIKFTRKFAQEFSKNMATQISSSMPYLKLNISQRHFQGQISMIRNMLKGTEFFIKVNLGNFKQQQRMNPRNNHHDAKTDYFNNKQIILHSIDKLNAVLAKIRQVSFEMLRMATIDPFRMGIKGAFAFTRALSNVVGSVNRTMSNFALGGLQRGFYSVVNGLRRVGGAVFEETKEIGDAIAVYTLNMKQLGISDKVANLDLKALTDYGKKSVYDANDLITQATTYRAFQREDSVEIVKALAGLSAQTKDPNESMQGIGRQLGDVLARQKVTWQDIKFMKGWFNALGANKVNHYLDEIAQGKGYANAIEAISENGISVDELFSVLKRVGLSEGMQSLVTTIATPSQALSNLKENLANQFVIPKFNEDGTRETAPLQHLYDSVRDFLLELSNIVSSDTFGKGVKAIGDDVGSFIDKSVALTRLIRNGYGPQIIQSAREFHRELKEGASSVKGFTKSVTNLVQEVIKFGERNGYSIGKNLSQFGKNAVEFTQELVKAGDNLIKGGLLDAFNQIVKFNTNLIKLGNDSGAFKSFADKLDELYSLYNRILTKSSTINATKGIVESISDSVSSLLDLLDKLAGTDGNALVGVINVFSKLFSGAKKLFDKISSIVVPSKVDSALRGIAKALDILVTGLANTLGVIIGSSLNSLGSSKAQNILSHISRFIVAIGNIFTNVLKVIGTGSVERGINVILGILERITGALTTIAELFASSPVLSTLAVLVVAWFSSLGQFIRTVWNSANVLSALLGTQSIGGFVGKMFPSLVKGDVGKGIANAASKEVSEEIVESTTKGLSRALARQGSKQGTSFLGKLLGSKFAKKVGGEVAEDAINQSVKVLSNTATRVGANTFAKKGLKVLTSGKFNLLALAGELGLGIYNEAVQADPKASNTKKQVVSGLTKTVSIASYAGTGATVGSAFGPYGTGIGAVAGALYGVYQEFFNAEKQLKERAKEEAKQIAQVRKEGLALEREQARQIGDIIRNINTAYANDISQETGVSTNGIQRTIQHIQEVAQTAGTTIETTLRGLGTNIDSVPQGINDMFVSIDGKIVSWRELRQQTGLNDKELLGALQQLAESLGLTYVQFIDEAGNLKQQVDTLTKSGQERKQAKLETVKKALEELGVQQDKLDDLSITKIAGARDDLISALDPRNFATKEDQKQAIKEAITKLDSDAGTAVEDMSLKQLRKKGKAILDAVKEASNTPQEDHVDAKSKYEETLNKYKEALNLTEKEIGKKVNSTAKKTAEEIEELIKQTEIEGAVGKKGGDKLEKLQSIKEQLDTASKNVKEGTAKKFADDIEGIVSSMNTLFEESNLSESDKESSKEVFGGQIREKLFQIGVKSKEMQDFIIKKLVDDGVSLDQAIQEAQKEFVDEGKIEQLQTAVKSFVENVSQLYEKGTISLDEAKGKLSGVGIEIETLDTTGMSNSANKLKVDVKDAIDKSGAKLEEGAGKANESKVEIEATSTEPVSTGGENLKKGTKEAIDESGAKLEEGAGKAKEQVVNIAGIDVTGIANAAQSLWNWVSNLMSEAYAKISSAIGSGGKAPKTKSKGSKGKWTGGLVKPEYRAYGGVIDWKRRGTDTIPTMLTEGEYVLRRQAVKELGTNFLNNLNARGSEALKLFAKPVSNVYNVYNNNNAQITQNVNNKSSYLNGLKEIDRFMRYV